MSKPTERIELAEALVGCSCTYRVYFDEPPRHPQTEQLLNDECPAHGRWPEEQLRRLRKENAFAQALEIASHALQ